MDRRQRKTREAIFHAFTTLLAKKDYSQITVGEIITEADVGRATFYAHFETKDFLLRDFCKELFCHIFDTETGDGQDHKHIFQCEGADSVFLHLFRHIYRNDQNILALLSSPNNDLFLQYFRRDLEILVETHMERFDLQKKAEVPEAFWKNHILSTFTETIRWWIHTGLQESPEVITDYFFKVL